MKTKTAFLIPFCLAAAFAFNAGAQEAKSPPATTGMSGHSAGSMELHHIMMQGVKMPMPMSGNVDKDFATMMSMHHQQAIKMIDVLLQHGHSADLKALASKMKAAQQEEIKQMAPYTK
jgi:uncharacterized protein (DUF305 family)